MDVLSIIDTIEHADALKKAGNVFPMHKGNQKKIVGIGLRTQAYREETKRRKFAVENSKKPYRIGSITRTSERWIADPQGCLTILKRLRAGATAFYHSASKKREEEVEFIASALIYWDCRTVGDLIDKLDSLISDDEGGSDSFS
jgi:hypothetical protein